RPSPSEPAPARQQSWALWAQSRSARLPLVPALPADPAPRTMAQLQARRACIDSLHPPPSGDRAAVSPHHGPLQIGVEPGHRRSKSLRLRAQILLIDHAALVGDERHDPRVPILDRIRDHAKAVLEPSVYHVTLCAARCRRALGREDSIAIPVI